MAHGTFIVVAALVGAAAGYAIALADRPGDGRRLDIVQTDMPVPLDIEFRVSSVDAGGHGSAGLYRGTATYRLTNPCRDEVRIGLPLLRMAHVAEAGTRFVDDAQLDTAWKERREIVLRRGAAESIEVPVAGFTRRSAQQLRDGFVQGRIALVLGAPDGADPDAYLVGTVVSEPIRWREAWARSAR